MPAGTTIGTLEIIEKVGAGGMASVYKARQPKLDRDVAVKVMHQNIAADPNFLARFEREARIVAKLDHPNIVPIYDYDDVDGQPFLVMKYIDGNTLKGVLREGPLPSDEVMHVFTAICDALQYAHDRGVLHRDIKPSNILIDGRGIPYLTDFGLARLAQQGESTMSADVMLGTPHYISPEQAQGMTDVDARADVYSLGVVLYELLTGRVPFAGDTSYAIIHSQINTAPPPPRTLNPDIPPQVEAVILKALAKDRADRFASVRELRDAYRDAVSGQRIAAPSSQVAPREKTPPPLIDTEEFGFIERMKAFGANMEAWGREVEERYNKKADGSVDVSGKEVWEAFKQSWKDSNPGSKADWNRQKENFKQEIKAQFGGTSGKKKSKDAHLSPEERIRRRIEKRIEKRNEELTGYIAHTAAFIIINMWLFGLGSWLGSLAAGNLALPHIVTMLWGIGWVAHSVDFWATYGPGYNHRQRRIDEEVARQMQIMGYSSTQKRKNDDYFHDEDDDYDDIRLTGDGELTDSFLEEHQKRKRR